MNTVAPPPGEQDPLVLASVTTTTPRWDWLHEPLLHFLLLGAVLFGLDHFLISRADDPRTIVVSQQVQQEAGELFKNARGQDPTPEQAAALRQVWLDNEVLYREGLALRVDQGDSAIRERVIFKALSVIESGLSLPAIDDKTLQAWFNTQRSKYDEPARFDFQEAVLSAGNSEAAVRAFCAELNGSTTGTAQAGLRVFKGRPHGNLVQSYGAEFANGLEALPVGQWQALQTREGWRAMRLDAVTPGRPAQFELLRGVVLQDWTDATMAQQRTAAVRALAKKYTVRVEGTRL